MEEAGGDVISSSSMLGSGQAYGAALSLCLTSSFGRVSLVSSGLQAVQGCDLGQSITVSVVSLLSILVVGGALHPGVVIGMTDWRGQARP